MFFFCLQTNSIHPIIFLMNSNNVKTNIYYTYKIFISNSKKVSFILLTIRFNFLIIDDNLINMPGLSYNYYILTIFITVDFTY